MKQKLFISGLCLTLALSLVGCGGQQAQEPQQTENVQPSEVVISEPPVEAQLLEVNTTAAPVEESQGLEDGNGSVDEAGSSESAEPVTQEVELFTEVNETVYATGTVNIRASWMADSEKLGSLGTGESVTRTGTGIVGTEADGWSRVSLEDGTIAYISTNYLSTTKPVTQSTQNTVNTSTGESTTPATTTIDDTTAGTTETQAPSKEYWDDEVYSMLTPEQKAVYESASPDTRAAMNKNIRNVAKREEEGWTTQWDQSDDFSDQWAQISMGQ